MHGAVSLAVDADTGAVDFGQAVDVVQFDAQFVGDATAHLLAPALGADDALAQLDLVADAALLDLFRQKQGVGAGRAQHGGAQVLHHLQLLVGIAGTHGDGHGAQALAAQLEADTRGPQAVAGGDMDAVFGGQARIFVAARELDGPVIDVLLGVGNDHRRAGSAAGRMDAHDLLGRNGGDSQRIGFAQVALVGEGQLAEILGGLDIGQVDIGEFLRIERRTILERLELLADHRELFGGNVHIRSPYMQNDRAGTWRVLHCTLKRPPYNAGSSEGNAGPFAPPPNTGRPICFT